jgi:hypothetical protein
MVLEDGTEVGVRIEHMQLLHGIRVMRAEEVIYYQDFKELKSLKQYLKEKGA